MHKAQHNGREHAVPVSMDFNPPNTFAEASQDEPELDVKKILRVLWRRLWVIVLTALVLAGSVVSFDFLQTPTYESTIKMLVGQEREGGSGPSNLGGDVQGLQQLTQTVAEVLRTRTVADVVIQRLELQTTLDEFLANMSVEQAKSTQVVNVSYRDPSPEQAQRVANTIGDVFSEQVSEVNPSANAITATVWETAVVPVSPTSPKPLRDGFFALVLGGMLGVGLAFLLERLDDRWRSPEEVEQISGVPNFGVIREFAMSKSKKGGD